MNPFVRGLAVGLVAMLAFALLPTPEVRAMDFSKGDVWTYDVTDSYGQSTMIGTMRTSYIGTATISVDNISYRVYVLDFNTTLSGESGIQSPLSSTSVTSNERAYYTIPGLDLVKDENDIVSRTVSSLGGGTVSSTTSEHNVTTFAPVGGFGTWPSSLSTGVAWNISYPSRSQVTIDEDGNSSSHTYTENRTIRYQYDGQVEVTTRAGTFLCGIFNETTPGWTQVTWDSEAAGAAAKIEQTSDSGEVTIWLLRSYTYSRGVSKDPEVFYAAGFAVAALSLAMVILILWRQKRKPTQFVPAIREQRALLGAHP